MSGLLINRLLHLLWVFAVASFCFAMGVVVAFAEPRILSAVEAADALDGEAIVVLDIRTRQEWAETGVAAGAWPVSMHEPDFGDRMQAILRAYPAEKIALICATGGRSGYMADLLAQNGITDISDVSEGMLGNDRGPGWVARGFETVSLDEALRSYEQAQKAWPQR